MRQSPQAVPYAGRHVRGHKRNGPDLSPSCAARRTLRIIGLMLVQRIDADDADLRTLAEQTRQAGELALAELGDERGLRKAGATPVR